MFIDQNSIIPAETPSKNTKSRVASDQAISQAYDHRQQLQPENPLDHGQVKARNGCKAKLSNILSELQELVVPEAANRIATLQSALDDFSVNVSLIGQVKAGKSALTNALIGKPNMLPSDVNPWTSVITSVHINTAKPCGKNAVFKFFTKQEWTSMVEIGGHLGEMAARAGFLTEMDEMRDQIREMQRRTESRLGKNFSLLMNGGHSFLGFSPEMIKKYVCLGEDGEEHEAEGRYADVTKSADLYIDNPSFQLPTVIHDTPGVNDPFLVREAVTLESLGKTDICVVVLSAQQSFSTVDVGLLRILLALKHEKIVLFVNRVDELDDPSNQISEIDTYIRNILAEQNLPTDLPIVFGSAVWAEMATFGTHESIPEAGIKTLSDLASTRLQREVSTPADVDMALGTVTNTLFKTHDLSGLYELKSIIEQKSVDDVLIPFLDIIRRQALDVANQSTVFFEQIGKSNSPLRADLDLDRVIGKLQSLQVEANAACSRTIKIATETMQRAMSDVYQDFITREQAALELVIEENGDTANWKPDTKKLRRNLNVAYNQFSENTTSALTDVFQKTAIEIENIYGKVLESDARLLSVQPPLVRPPKTPTSLMKTMPLDITTTRLGGWFTRRLKKSSFVQKFNDIMSAEMHDTLRDMTNVYAASLTKENSIALHAFLEEHMRAIQQIVMLGGDEQRAQMQKKLGMKELVEQRIVKLHGFASELETLLISPICTSGAKK